MSQITITFILVFFFMYLGAQDFTNFEQGRIGINVQDLRTYLTIQGETQAGSQDKRSFIKLNNLSNASSSVVNIEMTAGTGSGTTLLSHHSITYDFPGYNNQLSDFGQLYSRGNGLVLRTGSAENPYGVIKFMTGNLPSGISIERMRLSAEGYLGIGTDNPRSKLEVYDGDLFVSSISRGIILINDEQECYRISVNADGELVSSLISCPN